MGVKDASWKTCQQFLSNPEAVLKRMHSFIDLIDVGGVPAKNVERARKVLGHSLNPDTISAKSMAAAYLCKWLCSTIAYYERAAPIQERAEVSEAPPSMKAVAEASKYL